MPDAHFISTAAGTDSAKTEDLLLLVANGDCEALNELYDQLSHGLYVYALSIVKNDQDAQDILQDCFLSIVQKAASYQPRGKAKSWIYAIVHNRCMSVLRQRRKENVAVSEQDHALTDATLQKNTEDRLLLDACLHTLSDEERQIVMLHTVSGFRHREIAALLNRPLSTVLSKYNRALKKLRVILEKG